MTGETEYHDMVHDECGEGRFSWIVEMVQFGDVLGYEQDDGTYGFIEETYKNGDIVDSSDDLYCTECDEYVEYENLVPKSDHND